MPYYTWTHRHNQYGENRTKVYMFRKNPTYARKRNGTSYALLHDHDHNGCFDLIDRIE